MTKKNRLRKSWQRNWEFWMVKGVYFNWGLPIKYMLTPKQVYKLLKIEDRNDKLKK